MSSQSSIKERDIFLVLFLLLLLRLIIPPAHKQSQLGSEPVESAEWDPGHQSCLVSPGPGAGPGSEQRQASSAESFLASSSVLLQRQTSQEE